MRDDDPSEVSAGEVFFIAVTLLTFLTPSPLATAHAVMRAAIAAGLYSIGYSHAAYVVAVLAVFALAGSVERKVARALARSVTGKEEFD